MSLPAKTPKPPYYSVIFTSQRRQGDDASYYETAERMVELAAQQSGFLGVESARGEDGFGITVSYWQSLEDIAAWKANGEHLDAQNKGRKQWYENFTLHIARVEKAYCGP